MNYGIEACRKKQGISQSKLASKAGVSRTIISGLESGRVKNTTAGTLLKIASALGVSVDAIFFANEVEHGKP